MCFFSKISKFRKITNTIINNHPVWEIFKRPPINQPSAFYRNNFFSNPCHFLDNIFWTLCSIWRPANAGHILVWRAICLKQTIRQIFFLGKEESRVQREFFECGASLWLSFLPLSRPCPTSLTSLTYGPSLSVATAPIYPHLQVL